MSLSIPNCACVLGDVRGERSSLARGFLAGSYQVLERTEGELGERRMLGNGQTHLVLIREEAGMPDAKSSFQAVSPCVAELPSPGRMRRSNPGSGWDPGQDQCLLSSNSG